VLQCTVLTLYTVVGVDTDVERRRSESVCPPLHTILLYFTDRTYNGNFCSIFNRFEDIAGFVCFPTPLHPGYNSGRSLCSTSVMLGSAKTRKAQPIMRETIFQEF